MPSMKSETPKGTISRKPGKGRDRVGRTAIYADEPQMNKLVAYLNNLKYVVDDTFSNLPFEYHPSRVSYIYPLPAVSHKKKSGDSSSLIDVIDSDSARLIQVTGAFCGGKTLALLGACRQAAVSFLEGDSEYAPIYYDIPFSLKPEELSLSKVLRVSLDCGDDATSHYLSGDFKFLFFLDSIGKSFESRDLERIFFQLVGHKCVFACRTPFLINNANIATLRIESFTDLFPDKALSYFKHCNERERFSKTAKDISAAVLEYPTYFHMFNYLYCHNLDGGIENLSKMIERYFSIVFQRELSVDNTAMFELSSIAFEMLSSGSQSVRSGVLIARNLRPSIMTSLGIMKICEKKGEGFLEFSNPLFFRFFAACGIRDVLSDAHDYLFLKNIENEFELLRTIEVLSGINSDFSDKALDFLVEIKSPLSLVMTHVRFACSLFRGINDVGLTKAFIVELSKRDFNNWMLDFVTSDVFETVKKMLCNGTSSEKISAASFLVVCSTHGKGVPAYFLQLSKKILLSNPTHEIYNSLLLFLKSQDWPDERLLPIILANISPKVSLPYRIASIISLGNMKYDKATSKNQAIKSLKYIVRDKETNVNFKNAVFDSLKILLDDKYYDYLFGVLKREHDGNNTSLIIGRILHDVQTDKNKHSEFVSFAIKQQLWRSHVVALKSIIEEDTHFRAAFFKWLDNPAIKTNIIRPCLISAAGFKNCSNYESKIIEVRIRQIMNQNTLDIDDIYTVFKGRGYIDYIAISKYIDHCLLDGDREIRELAVNALYEIEKKDVADLSLIDFIQRHPQHSIPDISVPIIFDRLIPDAFELQRLSRQGVDEKRYSQVFKIIKKKDGCFLKKTIDALFIRSLASKSIVAEQLLTRPVLFFLFIDEIIKRIDKWKGVEIDGLIGDFAEICNAKYEEIKTLKKGGCISDPFNKANEYTIGLFYDLFKTQITFRGLLDKFDARGIGAVKLLYFIFENTVLIDKPDATVSLRKAAEIAGYELWIEQIGKDERGIRSRLLTIGENILEKLGDIAFDITREEKPLSFHIRSKLLINDPNYPFNERLCEKHDFIIKNKDQISFRWASLKVRKIARDVEPGDQEV